MSSVNISIWGSGSGSNAQAILDYFQGNPLVQVVHIASDHPGAYILERARIHGIPAQYWDAETRKNPDALLHILQKYQVNLVVLAGYLRKVSPAFLARFAGKVVNIHPALLPAYGGKGMFGHHVHEAVLAAKEKYTGITVHLVNEAYDEGEILFQGKLKIEPGWDARQLASEVLKLEHFHYPRIIEKIAKKMP